MYRSAVEYTNFSDRFINQEKDFTKQFCGIYKIRLKAMKELLQPRIIKKWHNEYPTCELHKLSETDYEKCIVIGTLFKDQKLKPSVLKQLAENNSLLPQPIYTHFTDDTDVLFIEDELQRYRIIGTLNQEKLVTGITCALLGTDIGNGKFQVEDYCFADFQSQIERPILHEDIYVVFISGLDLVHIEKSHLPLQLFVSWISGLMGDISIPTTKIVRLIIAGNAVQIHHEKIKSTVSLTSRKNQMSETVDAVKLLDTILLELTQVMDVDVMPGEHDPSNHILPQQMMHHCLFPKSIVMKSFKQVTNPYDCQIEGVRILGSSGQPVSNILGFSDINEPIDALECCLKWSHLAPTAPDTLGCFPFYTNDPFVIKDCPHVMFAGNQDEFNTKLCKGENGQEVRLICIPEFAKTFTVAALNLKNLNCVPIVFNTM